MRHPHDVDLPIGVDRASATPLPVQLADQIRRGIEAGALRPGEALPSTRTIAAKVGVSRGSVVAAFDQLHGEGWLLADRGATLVDPELARHGLGPAPTTERDRGPARDEAPVTPFDLRPGRPDVSRVVDGAWRGAWRRATSRPWAQHPAQGSADLRRALVEHLRLTRGTTARPEEIVVTAGVRDGFRLLLTAIGSGREHPLRIAVEDPGFPALRRVPTALGHTVLPIRVDDAGLRVVDLPTGADAPDLVLVTPGHQYPLGGAMPIGRRLDLLAWAREHQAIVVEDDYDGELRFTGEPLPALAALDRRTAPEGDRVVTLGSFAKLLAPGLGVGQVLLPAGLRGPVAELSEALGSPVAATVQDAMSDYLAAGALRRHTARMRRTYRLRQAAAAAALAEVGGVRLRPMEGGLHGVVELVDGQDEGEVVAALAEDGIAVAGLASYWADEHPEEHEEIAPVHGFVIGLGAPDLTEGLAVVAEVLSRG